MGGNLNHILKILRMGEHLVARQLLNRYISENPTDGEAWYTLSFLVDSWEQKIDCLKRALKWMPDSKKVKLRLRRIILSAQDGNQSEKKASFSTNIQEGVNNWLSNTDNRTVSKVDPSSTYGRNLWQMEPGVGDQPKRPDIIQFLVDDIAQLPIVTNPHQELWLGVQLRASDRFKILHAQWRELDETITFSRFLWKALLAAWGTLEQECLMQGIPPPRLERWGAELLLARRDVHVLRRSGLRRFVRRLQVMPERHETLKALDLTYQIAETLALLPGEVLTKLDQFVGHHDQLQKPDLTSNWLLTEPQSIEEQAKHRAKQTIHVLVNGYLRYALRVAQGYINKGVDYEDLVQAGFMGLLRAAERFDYRKQARFGTYATSWIWQGISRELADHGSTIRYPVHVHDRLQQWRAACEKFDDGLQKPINNPDILLDAGFLKQSVYDNIQRENRAHQQRASKPKEVTGHYDYAVRQAGKLLSNCVKLLSLSEIWVTGDRYTKHFDSARSLAESLPDMQSSLEQGLEVDFLRNIIQKRIFPFLTPKEREVLKLRHGWTGEELTLEEIGVRYSLTRERIRQVEAKAIAKLNNRLAQNLLPNREDLIPSDTSPISWDSGLRILAGCRKSIF
jgi:RNA polymerase sigma factor (sigma-70 family)